MKLLRLFLFPFAALYRIVISVRNFLFDKGLLKQQSYNFPVIVLGNLCVGGTGKTPHTEYLIKLLKDSYKVAVVSRGYGRKTSEYTLANSENTNSLFIGDEPAQIKNKFPEITVAVDAKRVEGINKTLSQFPETEIFILDDAFQHRNVKPGLALLLTSYDNLYCDDYLLPSGNLRECRNGANRADAIIVTKCPSILSPLDRRFILDKIKPQYHQKVFFSYMKYGDFTPLNTTKALFAKEYYFQRNYSILLLTGIANPEPLEYFIESNAKKVYKHRFADHHYFTVAEIQRIKEIFEEIPAENKIILTTEKDKMRLMLPEIHNIIAELPVFYLPLEICFHESKQDEVSFDQFIKNYVATYYGNR
ncbi:MAG: tetraacyldisaccharide 4'-kinase [Bacteroidia bacterium]|nr:MAG: tetraacyldisaccharide 4'-kinase [Bacteroidia bacterium]